MVLIQRPLGQPTVVSIDRWSLYRGALISLRWPMEQPTVVSVDRWSFYTNGLKTGFTVVKINIIQYTNNYYNIYYMHLNLT